MLLALLLTLSAAPTSPLRTDFYEARLTPREGLLSSAVANRGYDLASGIRLTVSGSILTALGAGFGALGVYGLLSAVPETGSTRTVLTVLGWTSAGFGMLLGAVGIPLLIVGIVKLSSRGSVAALSVSNDGALAVRF
jgi:hypothetical protein